MPKPSVKTVETDALRILMISRGISAENLASKCGVKTVTIQDAIAQSFPTRRLRLIVESALDTCIWSDPAEFLERQDLASRCGFDPFSMPVPEIQSRLASLNIRGRSKFRRKIQLIEFLRSKFPPIPPKQNENQYQ